MGYNRWSLIIFITFFLTQSCKNMSSDILLKGDGISFNPEVGSTYKYEIDETKEIVQAIGGSENRVQLTINSKIGLVYKVSKKINNTYEILVQFENCIMDSHSGEETERDFTSQPKNIEAFKGATFSFNLLADGRVENINGYKEFKEKFIALKASNIKMSNFGDIPDSSFREEDFKDIFEKISNILPSKVVFVNSSWLSKDSLEIGESHSLNAQHTLDSISAGIAYIKTVSPIEQTVTALNHSVEMKGEENGIIEVEATTGMLMTSSRKSIIAGNLKIGDVDVVVNINRRSVITGKKL
ncbi:DUF6263 family protein [Paraflavitalea sp. sgz302555]|uniref:DUF6263 family protein n=2 Tax=unclassified Paraflavitalea TaxID=2798305 RepID=UPI003D33C8D7